MDPWLERHWPDVHARLVSYSADELNAHLPEDLVASTEERISIEGQTDTAIYVPDVQVTGIDAPPVAPDATSATTALGTAYRLLARVEPLTEHFIRIVEVRTERLVTVIEFLSPANKTGAGLAAFRAKRSELLASNVNFVEIDLVRSGDWRALLRPHVCPAVAATPYRFTIRMPSDPGAVHFQPISLREPLPSVPIPLRESDPPASLPLQLLLDRVYANGRYHRRLDYSQDPAPALDPEEASWAHARVAGR